ncbi:vacuolar protein 14 C-terminal Fig4p binding-domain-containing protein [Scheffersomyces coipomensis]|uniref:vacuolar protein 14 C-terminal Fig4p binding-domain-containing protein n=1 Tax=Scheffersomyces coipomensis TaxID=1788519 RepID=UPI00315D3EA5
MSDNHILDQSIIKDLSNQIYEKRKATAFQIESLIKPAVANIDSQTIYKIILELTELTTEGTTNTKMGAITALGSVSIALGTHFIAYFLDAIIKPIFSTFRDTDGRVRYYACESLYNIAKIARGEILLYFNEVFDILCILVTDNESAVKNAADILDRLVKDIVSSKSTDYVSILHQRDSLSDIRTHLVDADGVAIQMNQVQESEKAFSLPKFLPTLLERMYTIDPFAKKFLIGWIELFDAIPSLELITFLPNFLEPLIKFIRNSPPDVRLDTENLLNIFLKEIKTIHKVKVVVKRKQLLKDRQKKIALQSIAEKEKESDDKESELGDKEVTPDTTVIDDDESIRSESTTIIRKPQSQSTRSDSKPTDANEKEDTDLGDNEEEEEEYLNGQDIFVDYPKLIDITLSFLRSSERKNHQKWNDLSTDPHDVYLEIQFISLKWLVEILEISPVSFLKFLPDCIAINLESIAITDENKDFDLRNGFLNFNLSLQDFLVKLNGSRIVDPNDSTQEIDDNLIYGLNKDVYDEFVEFQLPSILESITNEFSTSSNELARIASLEWLIFLYTNYEQGFFKFIEDGSHKFDLADLLKSSKENSNEVIYKVLQLVSKISESNKDLFRDFVINLVSFFEQESKDKSNTQAVSRSKIEFIIRKLCLTLSSEKIFKAFSEVLISVDDIEFLNSMIVTLNNILLTTQELSSFRKKLKNLDSYKPEDWSLFSSLFQSWCHNAPSALSLCLLTSNYELAYLIIKNISELEVTFQLLTQLDVLVQLLESPIFMKLRLQLLEPDKYPYLYKTLYGLLMILPQSSTFNTLKNRLGSVAQVNNTNVLNQTAAPIAPSVATPGATSNTAGATSTQLSMRKKRVYEMLERFSKVQDIHEEVILEKRFRDPSLFKDSSHESSSINTANNSIIHKTNERITSQGSTYPENNGNKKDYFAIHTTSDDKIISKRSSSSRLGLNR